MPPFPPGVSEDVLNFSAELGEKSVGYRRNVTNDDHLLTKSFSKKQKKIGK
jgi:hypothetical protein